MQVRRHFHWIDVSGLLVNPPYPFNDSLRSHTVFTLRFDPTWGDGVRIIGTPGGPHHLTSIAVLAAYYDSGNLISDGGFEFQLGPGLSGLWKGEGPGPKGTIRFEGRSHSGVNNACIGSGSGNWNAIVQTVPVQPHTDYIMTAWVRSNMIGRFGHVGVRAPGVHSPIAETSFGAKPNYARLTLRFSSGAESSIDIYIGIRSPATKKRQSVQVDDVSLLKQK